MQPAFGSRRSYAAIAFALFISGCGDDTSVTGGSGGTGGVPSNGGGPPQGGSPSNGGGGSGGTSADGGAPATGGSGGSGTGGSEPLVPPPCPAGTAEVAVETACGPGPDPSDAMVNAVDSATRGDIVTLGADIEDAGCMPLRTCVSDAAPTLIFSDEPESVDQDGVLYADVVDAGHYRLYVYHVNDGVSRRRFTAVALNEGNVDASLTVTRSVTATPDNDYLAVGQAVAGGYFAGAPKPAVAIPPGVRVVIDSDLDALVADSQELIHGIVEIQTSRPLKISIVSVGENADAAAVTAGLSLLANTGTHLRGTFPLADRLILARHPGGVAGMRLGADLPFDPDLQGQSFVDGGAAVTLAGNFGVLYDVRVTDPDTALALAINPRGGAWEGSMFGTAGLDGNGGAVTLPTLETSVSSNDDAVMLGRYTSGITIGTKLLTGGGSSLPIVLAGVPIPEE